MVRTLEFGSSVPGSSMTEVLSCVRVQLTLIMTRSMNLLLFGNPTMDLHPNRGRI